MVPCVAAGEAAWLYFVIELFPVACKKLWADGNTHKKARIIIGNRKSAAVIHYEAVLVFFSISSEYCLNFSAFWEEIELIQTI